MNLVEFALANMVLQIRNMKNLNPDISATELYNYTMNVYKEQSYMLQIIKENGFCYLGIYEYGTSMVGCEYCITDGISYPKSDLMSVDIDASFFPANMLKDDRFFVHDDGRLEIDYDYREKIGLQESFYNSIFYYLSDDYCDKAREYYENREINR